MSQAEVVDLAAIAKDQTAALEPQSNSQIERTAFAGEQSGIKPGGHSTHSEEPAQRPDDTTVPIEQSVAEDIKEHDNTDGGPQSDTLHIEKKNEDPMSEGTDIYEEDTSWRHVFANDKNLDERRKKAPKRVRQFSDYIKLMEDRMAAMEEQLRKMNSEALAPGTSIKPTENTAAEATAIDNYPPPPLPDPDPPPPPPPPVKQLQLGIAHLKWEEFDRIGSSGKHVIDVLIGDVNDVQPDYMKSRKQKKAAKAEDQKKITDDNEKKAGNEERKEESGSNQPRFASAGEKRSLLPERMCINSDLLLAIINEITSLTLNGPLVIIRPFKVLINWEPEIRQRLSDLEAKWKKLDALAEEEKERAAAEAKAHKHEAEKVEEKKHAEVAADKDSKHEDTNTIGAETPIMPKEPDDVSAEQHTNDIPGVADATKDDKNLEPNIQGPEMTGAPAVQQVGDSPDEPEPVGVNQDGDNSKGRVADLTKEDQIDKNLQSKEPNAVAGYPEKTQAPADNHHAQQIENRNQDYDGLQDDILSTDGRPALKRLRLLVKFMDEEVTGPLAKLKEAHRHQQVFFADLFHFFIPGDEVYKLHGIGDHLMRVQAYRILQVVGGRRFNFSEKPKDGAESSELLSPNEVGSPLVITCIHIDFDGKELGPVTTTFTIKEYTGERSTASLPVCPPAFMKVPQDLREVLEQRGQRFIELAQVSHKEYTGLTLDPIEDIDSQVIVDFDTTFQVNPNWAPYLDIQYPAGSDPRETAPLPVDHEDTYEPKGTVLDSYENEFSYMHEDASVDQIRMNDFMEDHPIFRRDPPVLLKASSNGVELSNDDKRLLPGRVFGFVLRSRTWAALSIHLVKDLPIKQDGFEQLVLPDGHKDLVRALVKTHSRAARPASGPVEEKDHQVDLVKGKGKGLIIHYTQRPLFPITCGDIGETAMSVEANLGKSFQLAHKWGCVLLLDEADVFMAKRSGSDIQRNSLVSVFLRILEYYSGILFLTTNRVGIFDPAFKSRIHISLYYPPLSGGTTLRIWRVNITRTRTSEKKYEVDEDNILEFAKEHFLAHDEGGRWNGRQIRNAFQTAIALAEYDATEAMRRRFSVSDTRDLPQLKPRVTVDHFRKVASAASDFDRYLKDVYGGRDEADRAFGESLRKDDWGQQAVARMRPPVRGGNNSGGFHQSAQYRQPQQQRFHGRDMFHSEASFEDVDPFQESKHPVLPNEAESFNKRLSPDPRSMTRPDRGQYDDEFGGPSGGPGSSNTPSPWSVSGGPAHSGRMQTPQNGRPRMSGRAHFEESEYKMEMTHNFAEFDDNDPRGGHGREGQGRVPAY
ncbi:MAG: hypothetical protein Q9166_003265 [cf. Caloplaca sp. 2 TL-2023]